MEDWELGKHRNEKQQSPTVERKELYSLFSINHMKKNKNIYIFMCITESHCCVAELNATMKISHISI